MGIPHIITTDASSWGAHLEGRWAQGIWSQLERQTSSNWKELMAVASRIAVFEEQLRGRYLQVRSDKIAKVTYLNKVGSGAFS